MLSELTIVDFAIIDRIHLRFGPGFNVLTGETGAGKSIIIDAVHLLVGGRGEVEFVRSGADRAIIEGVFTLDSEALAVVWPLLDEAGLEGDRADVLLLARELRREGRNICRVNGRAVSLKVLKEVGEHLVDIHGQTEHLSLMRVREHIDLLDRYGDLWSLRDQVADLVRQIRAVRRELADLRQDERALARRMDLLRHQANEIEAARLMPGEELDLTQERTRLANAEQLAELAGEAQLALYEGAEDQVSAVDLVQTAARALAGLARLDPATQPFSEAVASVSYQLEDLVETLRDYREKIESNPRRLSQVEERLTLIHNLKRKYGDSIGEVHTFAERARRELDAIEHGEERITELELGEDRLLHDVGRVGADLSARRREAGERLAAEIEAELEELSMARSRFGVQIDWRDSPDGAYIGQRRIDFDLTGVDRVEFLVAPNVGEPLKPLVRIASGGETSRLMLALKAVLAQADRTPTLIFDEIDAGIGGRVGSVVGQKLWGLTVGDGSRTPLVNGGGISPPGGEGQARQHQVLCVTHLPQLASYGDVHLRVEKGVLGDRTVTTVHSLADEEREGEIAAMLGVDTDRTRASAREILAGSEAGKRLRDARAPERPL